MATVLETKLIPTDDDGGYLLVCGTRELNTSGLEHSDTRFAVAQHGHLSSQADSGVDLLQCMTLPRSPSRSEHKKHQKGANGQLKLAESGDYGPEYSKHYRGSYERFSYAAEMAMTERLWLPHAVAASRQQQAFAAISIGDKSHVVLRHIDCESGNIRFEQKLKTKQFGFANDNFRLWCKSRGSTLLDNEQPRVLVRNFTDSSRDPKAFFEERSLAKGLPVIAKSAQLPVLVDGYVAQSRDFWIASEASTSRGSTLRVFEKGSLKEVSAIKLARSPISIAAALYGSVAVCGFIGGAIWVVDLANSKIRKFNPHVGAAKDHWSKVGIADNQEFVVSECDNNLVLTRLSDGLSAKVHTLEKETLDTEPFMDVDTSVFVWPTFALLGDRLGISEKREVRELSTDPEQYEHCFVSEAGRPGARKPVKVSRKAPLNESIKKARLGNHEKDILGLHSPALTLGTKKLGKRGWAQPGVAHAPELGGSRLGGWPDLPESMEWPVWRDRPMSFLGQIDLAAAREAKANPLLPKDGMLSFFVGCSAEHFDRADDPREQYLIELLFDLEPGEENGWRVLYTPAGTPLERKEFESEPFPELHRPSLVKFKIGGKSLPDITSAAMAGLALNDEERSDYLEMLGQLQKESWDHQFMGYASTIQFHPPEYYCVAGSFECPSESDEGYPEFVKSASEWTLILQLTSDGVFEWGDGGHFYFYARREDVQACDFSNVRVYFEN